MSILFFLFTIFIVFTIPRIIKNPSIGFFILLATLPFERIPSYEAPILGGVTLKMNQVAGLILISVLFYKLIYKKIKIDFDPQTILFILYLLVSFISILGAGNIKRAIYTWIFTVFVILVAYSVSRLLDNKKYLEKSEKVLYWITFFVCIFGFYQFIGSTLGMPDDYVLLRDVYGDITKIVLGFPRVQAFSLEPLYLANFLLIPFSLFYAKYLFKADKKYLGIILLISIIFILTFSRGIYIAGISVIILFFIFGIFTKKIKNTLILLSTVTFGIIIGISLITASSAIVNKGTSKLNTAKKHATEINEKSKSVSERKVSWDHAIAAFKEKPIFGIGIGNFGPWELNYPKEAPVGGWNIVNNETLEILAETGIIGFVSLISALLLMFYNGFLLFFRTESKEIKYWSLGLLISLVGISIQYQSFSTLYIVHIWVVIGMLIALSNINKKINIES